MEDMVCERTPCGIGVYAESALHAELKNLYAGGRSECMELSCEGKVVDVTLPDEFVEIQTKNIGAIWEKVLALACRKPVRVVHPIITENEITRLCPESGAVLSVRKRKTGRVFFNLFDELIHAPLIVASPNVRFDVLLVSVREVRVRDGTGSWRRRGDRLVSRRLASVIERKSFNTKSDWLSVIPAEIAYPVDSGHLGAAVGLPASKARKILYTFSRAGLFTECGRRGNSKLYKLND